MNLCASHVNFVHNLPMKLSVSQSCHYPYILCYKLISDSVYIQCPAEILPAQPRPHNCKEGKGNKNLIISTANTWVIRKLENLSCRLRLHLIKKARTLIELW